MKISIINSGSGNIASLKNMLSFLGYNPVVCDQVEDLNKSDNSSLYYVEFINEIKNNVTTIDLGEVFVKKGNVNDLYVSDSIGAHLNKSGNKIVADTIKDIL